MFLLGIFQLFAREQLQIAANTLARRARLDDVVDEAACRSRKRIGELVDVLRLLVFDILALTGSKDDLHRSLGAHHGDLDRPIVEHVKDTSRAFRYLSRGPRVIDIATKMLR